MADPIEQILKDDVQVLVRQRLLTDATFKATAVVAADLVAAHYSGRIFEFHRVLLMEAAAVGILLAEKYAEQEKIIPAWVPVTKDDLKHL